MNTQKKINAHSCMTNVVGFDAFTVFRNIAYLFVLIGNRQHYNE